MKDHRVEAFNEQLIAPPTGPNFIRGNTHTLFPNFTPLFRPRELTPAVSLPFIPFLGAGEKALLGVGVGDDMGIECSLVLACGDGLTLPKVQAHVALRPILAALQGICRTIYIDIDIYIYI